MFALTCEDALEIVRLIAGFDPAFAYSRSEADDTDLEMPPVPTTFRFGIPAPPFLTFAGDRDAEGLFTQAVARMEAIGAPPKTSISRRSMRRNRCCTTVHGSQNVH